MAFLSSGCVVAGPPDYQEPQKTPPILDLSGASPQLTAVIPAYSSAPNGPTTFTISVSERAEDAGDPIFGLLYLDYFTDKVLQPGLISKDPATFDTVRTLQISWSAAGQQPGCHSLTLEVTHQSNRHFTPQGVPVITIPKDNSDDVAFATWWVNIDPADPTVLDNCDTQPP